MKAPNLPYLYQHQNNNDTNTLNWQYEENVDTSTPGLHKMIANVITKRRQIRRKLKCSNLFAEAVLSNTIRKAQDDLARKQEMKRRNLEKFKYNDLRISNSNYKYYNQAKQEFDDEVKNCLANIDSFFDELDQVNLNKE